MRVNLFYGFLWIAGLLLTVAAPHISNAQGSTTRAIDKIEVSVELNNEPLENCLKSIERQTGLLFAFRPDQVDPYTTISLPKATRTVSATLDLVLAKTSLTYRQMNNSIVIFEKPEASQTDKPAAVVKAQKEKPAEEFITGRVTDADGVPIPEVNVQIKGASAVTTDLNGLYTIQGRGDDVLVFSFVGYKTVEAKVGKRKVVDLSMEYDVPLLEGVEVNAGYWKVAEALQTGNISRITAKDIENQPVSNPLVALTGRMPGVYVHQYTGVPGGGVSIQIRGTNSLRPEANYPLYIVDGVPFPATSLSLSSVVGEIIRNANPLANINPADIESIEVLKDADATAIYGSRGANGVVLITTKTGHSRNGNVQVNVDFRQGVGKVTRTMDLLNTAQWIEMRSEAFKNDGVTPTDVNAPDLLVWGDSSRSTDWQKVLIGGTARIMDAKASFAGGAENTEYLLSTNYYRESTVFPGDFAFRKGSAHFNFKHSTKNDRIALSLLASYTGTANDLPKTDPTAKAIELAPLAPKIFDDKGGFNWENHRATPASPLSPTWVNPLALMQRTYTSNTGTTVVNSVLKCKILPGLFISSNVGYTQMQVEELQKNPISSFNPILNPTGASYFSNSKVTTWISEPTAEYTDTILTHLKLKVLAGTTFQQTMSKAQTLNGRGYTNDELIENAWSAPEINVVDDTDLQYRYTAVFSRINLNWKEKYLLNLTGRRDGSSRFGPEKRFANFGAVGAAWIFSSEPFAESVLSFLSHGKLRTSYGITGSDQIGDYQYYASYKPTSTLYTGIRGINPTRFYNPDYSWETNKKAEIALELGFAGNRILLSTSYYVNRSSNQLVGSSLPVYTGQSFYQHNLGAEVQNKGVEVMLNTVNIYNNNVAWKTYFNATIPHNKLAIYPNIKASEYNGKYIVGHPLSILQKFQYTGVDPETGIYTFQDVDNNGSISAPDDYAALENITQQFYGGIQNNIRYKSWQLDFMFQFVKQTGINYLEHFLSVPGTRFGNQPVEVMKRWQQPGDITDIQRFTQKTAPADPIVAAYNNARTSSDHAIDDASFVRLKNISLSWQFRPRWLEALRLQQGNIYVQGQNLLTFTNYLGYDPEIPATSRTLPPLRILMAGVHLTF